MAIAVDVRYVRLRKKAASRGGRFLAVVGFETHVKLGCHYAIGHRFESMRMASLTSVCVITTCRVCVYTGRRGENCQMQ